MANKIFFPPKGFDTFSNNIVGLQTVDGGGLTQGNFEFTSAIYEKANRSFDTGIFSIPYTLENLKIDDIEQAKKLIQKNFKVYPNFDISEVTSFCLYGSLQKRLSSSALKIINYFPAAIEVISRQSSGLFYGDTASNISYDPINDETTFQMNSSLFRNPFDIDFSQNSNRNLELRPQQISEYRNLTNTFEKYALYFSDLKVEYKINDFIPTISMSGGTVTLTVVGDPFEGLTSSTKSLVIKPNNEVTDQIFNDDFDEIEDFLLNRNAAIKYTAKFVYPDYDDSGKYTLYTKYVTWPINAYWNLSIEGSKFTKYLEVLQEISEKLDEYKTNLISRFLITGSFKDFDTSDQKIEKILQIYGRSFDEVKKFIDALANINSVNYKTGNDIPSQLLSNLSKTLGMDSNISPISNDDFLKSVFNSDSTQIYSGQKTPSTPTELNYQYYKNLILNSAYMFRTKGTRKSLEYVMRFIGAPDALLEMNEVIYVADSKISIDDFNQQYSEISGGTQYIESPVFDQSNTYKIKGVQYTAYTNSGYLNSVDTTLTDYGIDDQGYPKSPNHTESNFFQKGAGWFETSSSHRSPAEVDSKNTSFDPSNPFLITKLKNFNFGKEYMDKYRKFSSMTNVGYTLRKVYDNKKSWAVDDVGSRSDSKKFNGVNYKVNDERLVINSKNLEVYINVGQGITYDIWDMSVKYNYPIPNSGLTAPYPYPGNIDWTIINPKPKEKTFFEFAQNFYNNFINVRNRQTIFDGKTGGYPTLQSVFWRYLESKQTVGIPSNNFTYQKMIDYTLGIGDYWQRLLEQVVPGTSLWLTGQKMENSIFHRHKFVWRRQRGCSFIPIECVPCRYLGIPFLYDCIDQTLSCSVVSNFCGNEALGMLSNTISNILDSSGYTENDCVLNSIVSTWYVDCRLDTQQLVLEPFYIGYGNNDVPDQTTIINGITDKLSMLYTKGLNYYWDGGSLIISNSTCYDDFTNKILYLNIGININITCN